MATNGTDFAAYGLPDPGDQYGNREYTPSAYADKIDAAFIADVWRIMDQAGNLLVRKHHDYGPKNISQSPGGPLNGLRVRMWDKLARINNLIETNADPKHESLEDSFKDMANYAIIGLLVLQGKWPND